MKIILQAGGVGTRMRQLTRVKPKSLVSAMYLPIIFHLFKKYRDSEFVIIGDYKFEILEGYLSTFAKDTKYIILKAKTKGNAAGIKEAISHVPANEPFMIIWSDIILSESFTIREIKEGCQVGVVDFPCSWSLVNGNLIHEVSPGNGVAGLYIFDNKSWFDDFPDQGSFTEWLAEKAIPLNPVSLMGSIDVGTLEAYNRISSTANRCRPYNKIEFIDGRVVKRGLTPEANRLIEREALWYKKMQSYGFANIPKIYSEDPLTMEFISGTNIFAAQLDDEGKKDIIRKLVAALSTMHSYESRPASRWDIYQEYYTKTIQRINSIVDAIPFAHDKTITINGRSYVNVIRSPHKLREAVLSHLMDTRYGPIHGDCQLTNSLLSKTGKIYFIDARGYFGTSKVLGDVRYDWAKVYYAINGNFDQFNIKNFDLDITEGDVSYNIGTGGWEDFTDCMFSLAPTTETNLKEIKLIHAIIWLSMASHAWEDFDSMCVAFYNGTALLGEWFEEYGDAAE